VMTQPPSSGGGKGLWIGLFVAAVVVGGGSAAYFATRGGDGGSTTAAAPAPASDQPPTQVAQQDPPKQDTPPQTKDTPIVPTDDKPKDQPPPPTTDTPPPTTTTVGATMISNTGSGSGSSSSSSNNTAYPLPTGAAFTSSVPMPLPPNWDPKAFDVTGYFKTAEAAAKQVWPDAQLVRIDADGVRPNGMSELTLDDEYYVRYWFKSETQKKPPAGQPIGVKNKQVFNLQVWVSKDGIDIQPMDWDDDEDAVPPPKCSFKGAWDKAIKTGAPGGNAVAEIGYMSNIVSHQIVWMIQVGDAYDDQLPDGC